MEIKQGVKLSRKLHGIHSMENYKWRINLSSKDFLPRTRPTCPQPSDLDDKADLPSHPPGDETGVTTQSLRHQHRKAG